MESQQELTKMEKYYKELKIIDNYWILKLIKIILTESNTCVTPKEKIPQSEEAELCIAVTIDSFPKRCHKFILNKQTKITWASPVADVFYYNEETNTL